jgi:pyrimidine-nucleoside phosphorylase
LKFVDLIAAKRDGKSHTFEELKFLANGAANGSIPDYQLSAWLMAAYLNPLADEETALLTRAMAESGARLDLSGLPKPWVDKHSTGGVGDKTTLVLLPILGAAGLTVVKMSGRGLGITGGTVDKLGSIPGFRLDLSPDEMKRQAAEIGLSLTGQSPDLAPADKVLYALRDVTATVGSIPLIVSSILSKKIAGGAEIIALDVKCGSGAFMEDRKSAENLAAALQRVGKRLGLHVLVSISDMDEPLGSAIGNALEVQEAYNVLAGKHEGPSERFLRLCLHYASELLAACGSGSSAEEVLKSGDALTKFKEWILAQGGSPFWDRNALPVAPVIRKALHSGGPAWVSKVEAKVVGQAVIDLGGGRAKKEDAIDPAVGIEMAVMVGSSVKAGDVLFTVHAADEQAAAAAEESVRSGIHFSDAPVEEPPLILATF